MEQLSPQQKLSIFSLKGQKLGRNKILRYYSHTVNLRHILVLYYPLAERQRSIQVLETMGFRCTASLTTLLQKFTLL